MKHSLGPMGGHRAMCYEPNDEPEDAEDYFGLEPLGDAIVTLKLAQRHAQSGNFKTADELVTQAVETLREVGL